MIKPLLDLYLELDNKISIHDYKRILGEFQDLWGNDIHIFCNNLKEYNNLIEFLEFCKNKDFATYSFLDGVLARKVNYLDGSTFDILIKNGVNAYTVIIDENIILKKEYVEYIEKISNKEIKLEVYFKANKKNIIYLNKILGFCVDNNIKLCIIDIDRKSKNRLFKHEYEKAVNDSLKFERENNIIVSLAECPYINIYRGLDLNLLGGCSTGMTSCMIDREGNVIPCMYLREIKVGNVLDSSLEEIWNSEIFDKLRDRNNLKGKCSKCKNKNICGGCRAESYYKSKDLYGEDYNCWMED